MLQSLFCHIIVGDVETGINLEVSIKTTFPPELAKEGTPTYIKYSTAFTLAVRRYTRQIVHYGLFSC